MEYKGIQYTVVQTANPTGWKWTVLAGKRTKTGTGFNRMSAIRGAERVIDGYVKERPAEQRNNETA
jgi:hypothetical protein